MVPRRALCADRVHASYRFSMAGHVQFQTEQPLAGLLNESQDLNPRRRRLMVWFLAFFFVSGFCSLLYELVWMRLAMAQFGVTTALTSIVISMFMAGLGVGSWLSGYFIRKREYRLGFPALRLYALIELLIGISSIAVPLELGWGRGLLSSLSLSSSTAYYLAAGSWIGFTLLPWCACMGATIPIVMLAIRRQFERESSRGFSYLYLSNVLGGVAGSLVPLVLIELYGFRHTLRIGFAFNILLAAAAMARSLAVPAGATAVEEQPEPDFSGPPETSPRMLALLFGTGFTSMGLEVVWIRQFTPYLGSVVYAFASILAVYLAATFAGSQFYRRWGRSVQPLGALLWIMFGLCALFASVAGDPFIQIHRAIRLVLGIGPFSALAGFATPLLVDRWSKGDPDRAGKAYAVNVAGCILGPLVAGFILLPLLNERTVSFALAVPWLLIGAASGWSPWVTSASGGLVWRRVVSYAGLLTAVAMAFGSRAYEDFYPGYALRRDNTATVFAATVSEGKVKGKMLVVNGVGMTSLSPNTKMMAHLPLAYLDHPPRNALGICFGMGTTFRSLLSWNIPATVVELVPSVPKLFWYFHEDAPQVLSSPLAHLVIDDGRRFLEQTSDRFDVITIDPPPPPEAAASSLLYSKQFYAVAKRRLQKGGILQQWLPYGDPVIIASVVRAVQESFPHVKMFHSLTGGQRIHFLASEDPLPNRTASELAERLPPSAVRDLMEWGPASTPEQEIASVVDHEWSFQELVAGAPGTPALDDDQPVNEYYFVRREFQKQPEAPQRSASHDAPTPTPAVRTE